LTNRLLGATEQTVAEVSDGTRGRHTTTGRELFELPSGGLLIDTPGMREFALFADDKTDLDLTGFEEIDQLAPSCRFRDCRHQTEPGCAVLAAIETGEIARERLAQAQLFEREADYQRMRHDPLRAQQKQAEWRRRSRASRAIQRNRG